MVRSSVKEWVPFSRTVVRLYSWFPTMVPSWSMRPTDRKYVVRSEPPENVRLFSNRYPSWSTSFAWS